MNLLGATGFYSNWLPLHTRSKSGKLGTTALMIEYSCDSKQLMKAGSNSSTELCIYTFYGCMYICVHF